MECKILIVYLLVVSSSLQITKSDRCVCPKDNTVIYMHKNKESFKLKRIEHECATVATSTEHWIKVLTGNDSFGYVPAEDVVFENCNKITKNDHGRKKRWLIPCHEDQCRPCICEHFGDLDYANVHKECYSCISCIGEIHCSNHNSHNSAQTTIKHHNNQNVNGEHSRTTHKTEISATAATIKTNQESTTHGSTLKYEQNCEKLNVIQALAEETLILKKGCTTQLESGSKYFVQEKCHAESEEKNWIQVRKVIDNCHIIAPYTAVGSRTYGIYGSFIDCKTNAIGERSIRIATQFCGKAAEIIEIPDRTNKRGFGIPLSYYTLTW